MTTTTASAATSVPSSYTAQLEKGIGVYSEVKIGKRFWLWEFNPRTTFSNWESDVTIGKRCWRWELNPRPTFSNLESLGIEPAMNFSKAGSR
jgi:hypothetical protein